MNNTMITKQYISQLKHKGDKHISALISTQKDIKHVIFILKNSKAACHQTVAAAFCMTLKEANNVPEC
ncbi:MAG: hypothetical protein LBB93_06085 [Elusimicrobiota bacterium]|jgi:methylglyoxal synthase|nr:hypothetical protein [Elusimicrobiota bacterium]